MIKKLFFSLFSKKSRKILELETETIAHNYTNIEQSEILKLNGEGLTKFSSDSRLNNGSSTKNLLDSEYLIIERLRARYDNLINIIKGCLARDAEQRFSAAQVSLLLKQEDDVLSKHLLQAHGLLSLTTEEGDDETNDAKSSIIISEEKNLNNNLVQNENNYVFWKKAKKIMTFKFLGFFVYKNTLLKLN